MTERIAYLPPAILDGMLAFQATGSLTTVLAMMAATALRGKWKAVRNI